MGKGNVRTRPFNYTVETLFPFIAHHNNSLATAIFTATLSSTPRLAITRYNIFHPSSTNNPLHYLYFSTRDYQIATCVTYIQSLPL